MDDIQITFRGMDYTETLDSYIRQRIARLERRSRDLVGCNVVVERPHRSQVSGSPYRVRISCGLPKGHDIVVVKDEGDHPLNDGVQVVINSAFKAAERQVQEVTELRRGETKTHDEPHGIVTHKFADRGYGFVRALDGRQIYFHENAVAHGDFEALEVGTEVRFAESLGEQGPQASSMQIIGKPGKTQT